MSTKDDRIAELEAKLAAKMVDEEQPIEEEDPRDKRIVELEAALNAKINKPRSNNKPPTKRKKTVKKKSRFLQEPKERRPRNKDGSTIGNNS